MLSFKTTIALQILRLLNEAGEPGFSITKMQGTLCEIQRHAVRQTVKLLHRVGWLEGYPNERFALATDLKRKTLGDLVATVDGDIRLGHVEPEWEIGQSPGAARVCDRLQRGFTAKLNAMRLSDMMA